MTAKKTTATEKLKMIFVGRSEPGNFVRNYEVPDGDEFRYEIFTHGSEFPFNKTTEAKLRKKYNLVIGPFRTARAGEIFRDREGVNSVESAEAYAR